jgi:hypothetical protein
LDAGEGFGTKGELFVRRHAKAPSAGSTTRQANGLGSFFRGSFATRGISGDVDGSGARSGRLSRPQPLLTLCLCLAVVATLAALASPALAVGAVNVQTGPATNVTPSAARLTGTVNPEGVELEQCRFEYGTSTGYGSTVPCAESVSTIGSGSAPVSVHADLTGLSGGTEYHFRLTGKNNVDESQGADATFLTLGPSIRSQSLIEVFETGAIFGATIDPNGAATTYVFEYVSEADFAVNGYANAAEIPAGGELIGAGTDDIEVVAEVEGLSPLTTYHVRVVASSSAGTTTGADLVFTTFAGKSSGLPDGRAYEQATPVDKNGANAQGSQDNVRTSPSGNGISYYVNAGVPGAEGSQNFPNFLALRGPDGWSTQGLLSPVAFGSRSSTIGLSEDLSRGYATAGIAATQAGVIERDTATKQVNFIYSMPTKRFSTQTKYVGGSADNSKVVLESPEALLPGAAEETSEGERATNLYFWDKDSGEFSLVGVFNDGTAPPEGAIAGAYDFYAVENIWSGGAEHEFYTQQQHVISDDGKRIFFTSAGTTQLYMRVNPTQPQSALSGGECTEPAKACTIEVSKSQRTVPDPLGPQRAGFVSALPDGSQVFILDKAKLTNDANTGPADENYDLYRYDTGTGALTDLIPATGPANPDGAEILGVIGTSDDGSYVYFAANGLLAPGAPSRGTCGNGPVFGTGGVGGICNIYLWHEGQVEFVSQTGPDLESGSMNWALNDCSCQVLPPTTGRVTPDGRTMLFRSAMNLTDYDSHGFLQLYRYRAGESGLICVSCVPTGLPPKGNATTASIESGFIAPSTINPHYTRNLSASGDRVFFESVDKLLQADTNGVKDVYEWEANGSGSCNSAAENGGCLYLLSTGTSPQPSFFADASESGNDAFIYTTQPLVGQDLDELVDVYDARVGGGLASQNPPLPSICTGEACRPQTTAPPATQSPGTSSFSGPPNPQPKKHKKKKHHKKKHHKKHHQKKNQHKKQVKREQGSNR